METIIISILAFVSLLLAVLLIISFKKLNIIRAERTEDILKTNNLLLHKSEKELKLFFEFEAVIEESIRISKETKKLSNDKFKELIELQKEIIKLLK